MFNWLFKKEENNVSKKIRVLETNLKESFSNIKKDMDLLFEYNKITKERQISSEQDIKKLIYKLKILEESLYKEQAQEKYIPSEEDGQEDNNHLTEISQKICMILAALHKENPKRAIPLKILAEEMYPNKKYAVIRSTISQYTTTLEKLGYITKKKRGRQVYLVSTDKNPYIKKKLKQKVNFKY